MMESPFTNNLLQWNLLENTRTMPWKGEKDPYRVWLSEIILQQTRVEQGLAYYNKFVNAYPSIDHLAAASEQEIFKLWEGLGYYSRCKNLIETAKFISVNLHGRFPDTYDGIRALKGIGPYTAAAIGSFAFNLPYAVVDGNVFRVLSRYFGISTPVDSTAGKKLFNTLAGELLDQQQPALYNQAIMDFGALICKAQQPLCNVCVQQKECKAYNHNLVKALPVKDKALTKKTRRLLYFVVEYQDKYYIRKRGAGDIWENLYEFILVEHGKELLPDHNFIQTMFQSMVGGQEFDITAVSIAYRQQLTHQTIIGQFITVRVTEPLLVLTGEYAAVKKTDLLRYPFPRIISKWIAQNEAF